MSDIPTFLDDRTLQVGATRFHCHLDVLHAPEGELAVMKPRVLVEQLLTLLDELRPSVVVELGIKQGGSTALLHAAGRPERLVSIELDEVPPARLIEYIEQHGLHEIVRPHFGVDQADRERVAAIIAAELRGRPIDLVIDDASHLLAETRTSFEILFPLVRPGGVYVIEDWQGDRLLADGIAARVAAPDGAGRAELEARMIASGWTPDSPSSGAPPGGSLIQLPVELLLARASRADAVRSMTVLDHWIVVHRGDDPLDPGSFRVADLVGSNTFGLLPGA
jgi:predicted O-methyltransferase YrrM